MGIVGLAGKFPRTLNRPVLWFADSVVWGLPMLESPPLITEVPPLAPTVNAGKFPIMAQLRGPSRYPQVEGYEILGELGRGGMGVVYSAKQQRLNRVVALKMMLRPEECEPSDIVRFRSEAEAVAAVKHPHIVQVFEFGHSEGSPYLAMEFLAGGALHTKIKSDAPFAPERAAELVGKLARAVHAAHSQGIVHRDLKPGNVLFDAAGEPRVTDFGLAKRFAHRMTHTQAIMGTPGYMPPEQAAGNAKQAGPPADIYALGVILFECLTGELPFAAGDSMVFLHRVINEPAPSLRSLNRALPRDLDLICLKCLEKNPNDRYPTAASLADDLARFVSKEPVSVRPAGPVERAVKWAKRRPTLATAYGLAVLAVALILFGSGAVALWQRAVFAKNVADARGEELAAVNEKIEATSIELAKKNTEVEEALRDLAEEKAKVEVSLSGEKTAVQSLKAEKENVIRLRYFRDVGTAQKELNDRNFLRAMQLLQGCPEELRGWEWWHVYKAVHPEQGTGVCRTPPCDAAFEPATGKNVYTADQFGALTRFDFAIGKGRDQQFHPSLGVEAMKISADGKRALIVGTNENDPLKPFEISVWDTATARRLAKWIGTRERTTAHAISGDGNRIMLGVQGKDVRVFDVPTGKELPTLKDQPFNDSVARMGRTGAVAAIITRAGIVVWDTATGGIKKRIPPPAAGDAHEVAAVANGDDTIASGTRNGTLRFDAVAAEKSVAVPKAHVGPISNIAFHPGGTMAATAGEDGAVRIWEIATGKLVREFYSHTRRVVGLNFNAGGEYLVSCDEGKAFRVWPVGGPPAAIRPIFAPPGTVGKIVTDASGDRLFDMGDDRAATLWPAHEEPIRLPVPDGQRIVTAAFHPKRKQLAFGTDGGRLYLWDSGEKPRLIGDLQSAVQHIEYSADGDRLLAGRQLLAAVWDTVAGKKLREFHVDFRPGCLVLSPNGKWIAAAVPEMFECCNVDTAEQFTASVVDPSTAAVPDRITALCFNPENDAIVVGTRNWRVHFCKLKHDDEVVRPLRGHTSAISSIAFNSDGTQMATGSNDGIIKVWDMKTKEEALGLSMGEREPVERLAWAPGQGWLAKVPNKMPIVFEGIPRKLSFKDP